MSVKVSTWVWEYSKAEGGALLVMLAIADFTSPAGFAYPSVATIAKMARMSTRQVIRLIQQLELNNELEIKRNGGPKGTHLFRIVMHGILDFGLSTGDDTSVTPDKLSPPDTGGGEGVTFGTKRGDIAVSPEPSGTIKKPSKALISDFQLPPWIPPDVWAGYEAMRLKIKKPMTDRARGLVVKKLLSLKEQGHEPIAVLEQSERNSWTDVYAIKAEGAVSGIRQPNWYDSDSSMLAKAEELGLSTKGLTTYQLKAKINEALTRKPH